MTYYDHESGQYIECDVVYAGRGAMPHEARDREHWQQKGNAILDAAYDGLDLLSRREMAAARNVIPADSWTTMRAPVRHCGCGRALPQSGKQKRCWKCKAAGRKLRRAA